MSECSTVFLACLLVGTAAADLPGMPASRFAPIGTASDNPPPRISPQPIGREAPAPRTIPDRLPTGLNPDSRPWSMTGSDASGSRLSPRPEPSAGLSASIQQTQATNATRQDKNAKGQDKIDPPAPRSDKAPIGAQPGQDPYQAYIRLEPPGRERLFGSRDTEKELEERMRQERRDTGSPLSIVFPERPTIGDVYQPRRFDPMVCYIEPRYVVYQPLYFEDKNSERYGWDLGAIQPAVSSLIFLRDVLFWPANFAAYPHRRFESNAGYCWPGDPVPYILYPPELTGSALLTEIGVIGLMFAAVP